MQTKDSDGPNSGKTVMVQTQGLAVRTKKIRMQNDIVEEKINMISE